MKRLIQKAIAPFGYTFRRISELRPFVPFVRELNFPDAKFKMWIANADAADWYSEPHQNVYEEVPELRKLVCKGDKVLEIGSHHGFTGLLLSRYVGDTGSVVGIEANPANALIDDAQITLNKFKNLLFLHFAASDKPGILKISTHHNAAVTSDSNSSEVKAITGDMLDSQYGAFNVLKVDVEGYEVEVLKGSKNLLSRAPKLALELHMDLLALRGHSVDDVFQLIDVQRYTGQMVIRPDQPDKIVPFNPSAVPKKGMVNVFLKHK